MVRTLDIDIDICHYFISITVFSDMIAFPVAANEHGESVRGAVSGFIVFIFLMVWLINSFIFFVIAMTEGRLFGHSVTNIGVPLNVCGLRFAFILF